MEILRSVLYSAAIVTLIVVIPVVIFIWAKGKDDKSKKKVYDFDEADVYK